jgi:hypothetical protein
MKEITVLDIEPLKPPRLVTIPHTLEAMNALVEGSIACTYPWEDLIGLVHNDNAIAEGAAPNRVVGNQIVYGPFFLAGLGEEDFTDIPLDLAEKYSRLFAAPEVFIPTPEGMAVIKVVAGGERL